MKQLNIIQRAIDFGTFRSRKNYFSFILKCLFYIIPSVLLGNYIDTAIKVKRDKEFDDHDYTAYYILLQTLIIITLLYVIILFSSTYTSEFQVTLSGGLFIVFYFGIQTNYINMIKEYTTYYTDRKEK